MIKTLFKTILFLAIILIAGGYAFYSNINKTLNQKIKINSPTIIAFKPGTTLSKLSNDLAEKKIISNRDYFKYFIKYKKTYQKFQAGHQLNSSTPPCQTPSRTAQSRLFQKTESASTSLAE